MREEDISPAAPLLRLHTIDTLHIQRAYTIMLKKNLWKLFIYVFKQ